MRSITLFLIFISMLCHETAAQVTYKMERQDGRYLCTGTLTGKYADTRENYGCAILWALDNAYQDKADKFLPKYDYAAYTLKVRGAIKSANDNNLYTFTIQMRGNNHSLEYLIDDIRCVPQKGVFAAMKVIVFDKLNLEKKPQHKVYVDEFDSLCRNYLENVAQNISDTKLSINHWDAIAKGNVVEGMNPNEVRLAKGTPSNVSENSQMVVWTFDSGTVVMFEKGIVTGVSN